MDQPQNLRTHELVVELHVMATLLNQFCYLSFQCRDLVVGFFELLYRHGDGCHHLLLQSLGELVKILLLFHSLLLYTLDNFICFILLLLAANYL
jgi:hypothetical protein